MSGNDLELERSGGRLTLWINRPQVHNALRFSMYEELYRLCDVIDADDSVRVVVLRGRGGKAFISGTDIGEFRDFESTADAIGYEERIERVLHRLEEVKRPLVAVLEGVCAGGGVPIALACDFRLANDRLRFGVPIAKTLGNCLSVANIGRLVDAVGAARTKEILMLGKWLDAQEAHRLGVVTSVSAAENIDHDLDQFLSRIEALAPLTQQATKIGILRVLRRTGGPDSLGADLIRMCYGSSDFREAVAAFMNKQSHEWTGR